MNERFTQMPMLITLETVTVGPYELHGIERHNDETIEEALAQAGEALRRMTARFAAALVHGRAGLVIFDPLRAPKEECYDTVNGLLLPSLCGGYEDKSARAAATVLTLFGFGRPEIIEPHINYGGAETCVCLTWGMRLRTR